MYISSLGIRSEVGAPSVLLLFLRKESPCSVPSQNSLCGIHLLSRIKWEAAQHVFAVVSFIPGLLLLQEGDEEDDEEDEPGTAYLVGPVRSACIHDDGHL